MTGDFSYEEEGEEVLVPADTDPGTITVVAGDPPTANDDATSTPRNTAVDIDVLDNDTDPENGDLTITMVSDPPNGTATINDGGTPGDPTDDTVTYTPDTDFQGTDTFTYTIEDPPGNSDQATVTVLVNDPPEANDDDTSTDEDTSVDIDVLDNDTDDSGSLTVTGTSSPTNGSATVINNGTGATQVRYTPNTNFNGTDSFTYTVDDGDGETDQATVTVTVNAVNDAPVASNDNAATGEDTPVEVDVLDNDSDVDGTLAPSTVTVTGSPSSGETSVNTSTGAITYTPDAGFSGGDTFSYTVDDNDGATSNEATVTITVSAANPPTANDDTAETAPNTPVAIDVLDNDTDSNGTLVPNSVTVTSGPSNGGTSVSASTGVITYTPNTDFTGTDTFTYTVDDNDGNTSNEATVTVTVSGNLPPFVVNPIDDQTVDGDPTPLTFDLGPVFDDPDGDPLSYQALSTDRSVATTSISGATLTVTPTGNGSSDILVTALDPDGASAQDAFSLTASGITVQTETFEATLSGAHAVPANASRATGSVTATLQEGTLTVTGSFSGLESPFNPNIGGGAHIHLGYFGQNGPVELPLNASVSGDGLSGSFEAADNTFELSDSQSQTLRARQFYVNIHTEVIPAGEIRGQLIPALEGAGKQDGDAVYRSILSGRAETTPNASEAVGGVLVERRGDELITTGAFSGLESDLATDIQGGAHIHAAGLDMDGGIVFVLGVTPGDDDRSGTFTAAENTFTLDAAQQTTLEEGSFYVNIHSETYPAGEIRGQILPFSQRVFEANLAGSNEVPPVMTTASGGALLVYDAVTSELTVSGAFAGLESDFATDIGAHIHEAGPAANGGVVVPLTYVLGDDNRSGSFPAADNVVTLDAAQTEALFGGQYYVNVHSADNPGGEVRGQILASTNVSPMASDITTPADGAAVTIAGDPATPFSAEWTAASDANDNDVVYRWQLALDAGFATVLVDTVVTGTSFTTNFGTVGTLLTANGVGLGDDVTLYHRALASDGSVQVAGPGAAVTLTRDALTAGEDADEVPAGFRLRGNYPNPFNPATTMVFDLSERASVEVEVLDLLGRRVLVLPARSVAPGTGHRITLDAGDLASGTYLVRVVAETDTQTLVETHPMTLVK